MIERIVSGGQTGADQAALDVALRHDFRHGGWCPRGRRSEAGEIPSRYLLRESPSPGYLARTEANVRDSDGTVVFTLAPEAAGGSLKTIELAKKHGKPLLHLSREQSGAAAAAALAAFVEAEGIRVLNVAGSRESKEPGIHAWVSEVVESSLFGAAPAAETAPRDGEGPAQRRKRVRY